MLQKIKNFFKRIFPPPTNTFNREVERILAAVKNAVSRIDSLSAAQEQSDEKLCRLNDVFAENTVLIQEHLQQTDELISSLEALITGRTDALSQQMMQTLAMIEKRQNDLIEENSAKLYRLTESTANTINEIGTNLERLADENKARMEQISTSADKTLAMIEERQNKLIESGAKLYSLTESTALTLNEIEINQERFADENKARMEQISSNADKTLAVMEDHQNKLVEENAQLRALLEAQSKELERLQKQLEETSQQKTQKLSDMSEEIEKVRRQAMEGKRNAAEAVWAEIFNNVITDSTWLKNTSFSPGRWAVGYGYLYVMYRILNETHPKRILELGLGQSTRMIAQYAAANNDVQHIVVESNQEWIKFFSNDFSLSKRTEIIQLDYTMDTYNDAEVRVYKDFSEVFKGQRFDFISIDAPLGSDMKTYSRVDVLKMLPDCLNDDFAIMLDDCQRGPEEKTFHEMKRVLTENNIEFSGGKYLGKKDCNIICSKSMAFLATL